MENKTNNFVGRNEVEVVYKPLTYTKCKQELLIVDKGSGKKETIFLYFAALSADLVAFVSGCSIVWSSPTIPVLKSTDPEINPLAAPITSVQESWIAALPCLGATIGPMLSGKFADKYGKKKTIMLLVGMMLICYIILSFATNIYFYYLTRFLLGIGFGVTYAVVPLYVGEICEDHNRGKFVCLFEVFASLGSLYILSMASFLSLKMLTLSCTIPLIFVLITFTFVIPETPIYLALICDRNDAIEALMKLRNKCKIEAEKEFLEITLLIEGSMSSSKPSYVNVFKTPALRKGLIICAGLCFFQQLAGNTTIMAFIGPIFELTGSKISTNLSAVLVATVQVISFISASVLVEKLGRRFLLLISTINSSISLIILGLYFYLKESAFYYITSLYWLPVTSLMVYVIAFNLGLTSVTWTIISEVFPSNIRSTASSLAIVICAITSFVVTFIFPFIVEYIGAAKCFWLFGGFCALAAMFVYIVVPETKGKTIVEIQKILDK